MIARRLSRTRRVDLRAVDVVVAAVLVCASVAGLGLGGHVGEVTLLVAAVVVAASVAWRRPTPHVATLIALVGMTVFVHSGGVARRSVELPLAVALDFYLLGRTSGERERSGVSLLLVMVAVPVVAIEPRSQGLLHSALTWALFVVLPFAAGRAIGSRSALARELGEEAVRLAREQEERALGAAVEERTRVARELHDVVAHSVSVMVIQTAAARRIAHRDRESARAALSAVQRSGRDALVEMQHMIGVLRRGDVELVDAAGPGLSQLSTLAERARAAGLAVDLDVQGAARELPSGIDLVAFRLVQEALTNAIKHAGPARARVMVRFRAGALEVEVSDNGRGPARDAAFTASSGHGLTGMRERVALCGGQLHAGGLPEGGFVVRAWIPVGERVAA